MLAEGVADAPTIDRACASAAASGWGPFELIDLIGLDVNLSVARSFYAQGGEPERWRPSEIQERMVGEGLRGRKNGRGFYTTTARAPPRGRIPTSGSWRRPSTRASWRGSTRPRSRSSPGWSPRSPTRWPSRSKSRSARPQDMDTAMRLGFNWPLGPVEFAELIGVERAVELLERLATAHGDAYRPAPGLLAAADAEHQLVDVAPAPVLAGLGRADDRVACRVKWAVACLPSELSQQPMWPQVWHIRRWTQLIPELQALLAAGDLGRQVEVLDRVEMRAGRSVQRDMDLRAHGMRGRALNGEPITEEGIEALREEIEELEGPAPHGDGGADQGRPRGGRPQGERRVPHRQGGPGAPGDPDQAPAGAAAQRGRGRGRRATPTPSPSAAPPRCSTRRTARSTPGPWSARPRPTSPRAASRPSRRSARR